MKFTASSNELLKALTAVAGAIPTGSKTTMPLLECALFENTKDGLRLTATDLEVTIVQSMPVRFETNGRAGDARVAVPAKRLMDTLRALPELPVEFGADEEFNVVLKTDRGVYKMAGFDGADYPSIPTMKDGTEIKTTGELIRRAIQKTGFAVSRDNLRPAMLGIFFQIHGNRGRAVATDGHRLVKLTLNALASKENLEFIVPEKAMSLAGKIAGDGPCTMKVDDSYVSFDFGGSRVIARQIAETYPNYEAVIPSENDRKLTVDRAALLSAVKRVGLYSSGITHQLRMNLKPESVEVSAEDIERASEAHEQVLAEYEGEPMEIGFNVNYLTEVLVNVDTDEVVFEFSSPNRAGVVTPGEQADGEQILMLIMPVMLNTYA